MHNLSECVLIASQSQVTLSLFRLILNASSEQGNGEVMIQLGIDRKEKVLQNRRLLVCGGLIRAISLISFERLMSLQSTLVWNFVRGSCSQSTKRLIVRMICSLNFKLGIYIPE